MLFLRAAGGKITFLREYFDPVQAAKALNTPILGLESWGQLAHQDAMKWPPMISTATAIASPSVGKGKPTDAWSFTELPLPMVEEDLSRGTLVRIELEPHPSVGAAFSMHAIHRKDTPPGPAGRWLVKKLKKDKPR